MKQFLQSARGSVMMEFIIVFPIYLVLFAAIMALGDMLVHSIRLPSAERTAAFDVGSQSSGWNWVVNGLFHPRPGLNGLKSEVADSYDEEGNRHNQDELKKSWNLNYSKDTLVDGPWSMLSGVVVRDDYLLPVGGTAGQLAFCDWFLSDVTQTSRAGGDFARLISGREERVGLFSKNVGRTFKDATRQKVSVYNYYTLKRRRYGNSNLTWRENNRHASQLLIDFAKYGNKNWRKIADEEWTIEGGDTLGGLESNLGNPLPDIGATVSASYTRYPQFVTWSN